MVGYSGSVNLNNFMLSKMLTEARELPWQPNFCKKAKIPLIQFYARNREIVLMNSEVFGVSEF